MSEQRYGSTSREFRDSPVHVFHDEPFSFGGRQSTGGYQGFGGVDNFNVLCDTISSNIFKINNNATSLDRSLKQLGSAKDTVHLRDSIHDIEQGTNRVINETAHAFRQLSAVCARSDRHQKLQYERLKNEFQETAQRYNILQKRVAEKAKSSVSLLSKEKKETIKDLISWGEADTSDEQVEEEYRRRRQQQLQVQDQVIDTDLELIQEREERIHQLEGDILDINEIFRELGTLVHEQGEVIDTIESNVESAYSQVESGNEQLIQATKYQRKARKKMCILVVVLVIIAGIIALIVTLSLKN